MENKHSSALTLPGSIIIAAAIISIAIIWVNKPAQVASQEASVATAALQGINLPPVTADDHILGNPNAAVKIVEYSDPSCAFCKMFHATMVQIAGEYGPGGKIAWVYRHYPLDQADADGRVFHPNAGLEAQALECAAEIGGNEKFWDYARIFYEVTPSVTSQSPQGLDPKQLPVIAKQAGIPEKTFNECLDSGRYKAKVDSQARQGAVAGVTGTPTSFFVLSDKVDKKAMEYIEASLIKYRVPADLITFSEDKKIISMSGAMPKAMISGLIETLIQ